ncbi:MAG: acetylxylan esterase [Planctomycetota bacterium]|nr:acetylxylan esterase [Planctomycetota bacterium]
MRRSAHAIRAVVAVFALCSLVQAASTIQVQPDKDTGIYDPGQTVMWRIQVSSDKKPGAGKVNYRIRLGGLDEVAKGTVDLAEGRATVTGTRDAPGALLLEVSYKGPDDVKEVQGLGGAVFAPDKIAVSAPPPDDFDKFWSDKIAALNAVPMNVQLTPVDIGQKGIEYFKITLDNINGTKIQGQIAKPAGGSNLPAMLQVQWAGVYKLERGWVTDQAKNGWLAMNIEAHDLPIDEAPDFYKKQSEGALNDYPGIGNDNRETSYFLRMFLSCYRAVDYLTQRPEWNKKTVLVHGGSQGGYQTLVIAGLHPAVTAFAASVPAGCDHTGKQAKRAPGWPNWASRTWQKKDYNKMLETSRYFDAVNFAARIKCAGIIGVGLIDVTCPPEGVLAACNRIQGQKKIIIMPHSGHMGPHNAYYAAFGPFLNEQRNK